MVCVQRESGYICRPMAIELNELKDRAADLETRLDAFGRYL
jgi:hypothetical protein